MKDPGERLRAEIGDVDLRSRDPGGFDLIPVGERQIEIGPIASAGGKPSVERRRRMTGVAKRGHHFRTHFSTAPAETGANRRHQISRLRSERLPHRQHCG